MATAARVVFSHITKDPRVCGGNPCIDNTRIRVIDIVHSALAYADENREEIEAQYSEHERAFAEGLHARDEYLKNRSRQ